MAEIRINALPLEPSPNPNDRVAIDGATTRGATIQSLVNSGSPIASEAEAIAGTDANKRMVPVTVKQSIASEVGNTVQAYSNNLDELSTVNAADTGKMILADSTVDDVYATLSTAVWPSGLTRTMKERAKDVCHISDFSIDLAGANDDTANVQLWLSQASSVGSAQGKTGNVLISSTVIIPKGVSVRGYNRYDYWASDPDVGLNFRTAGAGNPARWTDIDGTDLSDDTPMFVAGGNGVYLQDVSLITSGGTPWSMGILYPCVKQCGFQRLSAFGFTDGNIYLDLTWSNRNTTLKTLHPTIDTDTGMNEFSGFDFWSIAGDGGFALKIQGTTRAGDSVATAGDWLWGWGGASDTRFSNGRLSGTSATGGEFSHDAQLFGVGTFAQGTTIRDTAFRGNGSGYAVKLDRSNRIILDGCYGEEVSGGVHAINVTTNTQASIDGVLRINDKLNLPVYLNGVDTGFSGSTVPWEVTRCIIMHRVDGRDFTPTTTRQGKNAVAPREKSLAAAGEYRWAYDNGSTVTDFFSLRNDRIAPLVTATMDLGRSTAAFLNAYLTTIHLNGVTISSGSGTPEAVVTAPIGSLFLRTDGGATTTLYVKTSGAGNTGWTAK